jgi:hypothetical protein
LSFIENVLLLGFDRADPSTETDIKMLFSSGISSSNIQGALVADRMSDVKPVPLAVLPAGAGRLRFPLNQPFTCYAQ